MRTDSSRRGRSSQPGAHATPLVKKATQHKLRSSPQASHAARVLLGSVDGRAQNPGRGTMSPRRRRKTVGCGESGGPKGCPEFDSDGTLSIVNGIRGMACEDDAGTVEPSPSRGSRHLRPFEGTEGLLLLSMIAEAQESCKARKRVKLPDTPARRCGYCGARSTVQWRSGPKETPILCNACGVKYRKGKLHLEDRRVDVEDVENEAGPEIVHLGDLEAVSTNSSCLNPPMLKTEFEATKLSSNSKEPKVNTESCHLGGAHKDTLSVSLKEEPVQGNPSLWSLMPPLLLPNQPGAIPFLAPFGQTYPCAGGFRPIVPVPSLMHTNGASVRNGGVLGSMSHARWPRFEFLPGHLGCLDGSSVPKDDDVKKAMHQPDRVKLENYNDALKNSLKDLNSNLRVGQQDIQIFPGESEGTLRWLVKRRRTGPKAGM